MRKLLSLILTLAMVLTSVSTLAFATEADVPEITLASTGEVIEISTKAELIAAAQAINADANVGEGKTYKLMKDIDLEYMEWTNYMIGSVEKPFKGEFDGNNKTVRNFLVYFVDANNTRGFGLFGAVGGSAHIHNLGIDNFQGLMNANAWLNAVGAIAGQAQDNAKIEQCYVKNITLGYVDGFTPAWGQMRAAGGVVGRIPDADASGVIVRDCYSVNITVPETFDSDSGVVGYVGNAGAKIENCYSTYTVARYIAPEQPANITNCYYTGVPPWPGTLGWNNNTTGNWHGYVGEKKTTDELKLLASTLGENWSNDSVLSPINDGLPVLKWQYDVPAMEGAGTLINPYKVKTADDLALATAHNNSDGKYYKLMADIDMGGAIWSAPIGTVNNPFKGYFDGDGHKISNYTLAAPQHGEGFNLGLFGMVGGAAVIYDLGVENVTVAPVGDWGFNTVVGGIAGQAIDEATIKRCYAKNVSLTNGGKKAFDLVKAGGILGRANSFDVTIEDCYVLGMVDVDNVAANYSGVVGELTKFKAVKNTYSDTTVSMTTARQLNKVSNSFAVTENFGAYERVGTTVATDTLKASAGTLGANYAENDGDYPLLLWETGYDYPDEEQKNEPIDINTKEELLAIGNLATTEGKVFNLKKNIDFEGAEITPIGSATNPFKGTFNGNGHVIKNYNFNITEAVSHVGLFAYVAGDAVISRVGVQNVTITVENVSLTGGAALVGGLSGKAQVTECYARNFHMTVSGTDGRIWQSGAIVGIMDAQSEGTVVKDCYTTGYSQSLINSGDSNMDSAVVGGTRSDYVLVENVYSTDWAAVNYRGSNPAATSEAYPNGHIVNVHYAGKLPWPFACTENNQSVGAGTWYGYAGTKHDNVNEITATLMGSAFAEDVFNENKGYPVLSWEVEGVSAINSLEDLKALAANTQTEGKTFRLTTDIDMNGADWGTPIGTTADPFKGTFEGNGHMIKNYNVAVAGGQVNGLFGVVAGDASITNLGVENVKLSMVSTEWETAAGAIAGEFKDNAYMNGCFARNIQGITNGNDNGQYKYFAGLVAHMTGAGSVIENSYTVGLSFTGDINYDGGIVGMVENPTAVVRNCYSDYAICQYLHAEEWEGMENCYTSMAAFPWPWELKFNDQSKDKWCGFCGTQLSADELKAKTDISSLFVADEDGSNNGYPKLNWEPKTIKISTAEDLIALAGLTETEGNNYILMNDIDLGGASWSTPIGTEENPFKGSFDGKGFVIKNAVFNVPSGAKTGIFGIVGGKAVIKNLGVETMTATKTVFDETGSNSAWVGGLAAQLADQASIDQCYAKGISITGDTNGEMTISKAGGLVAQITGDGATMTNCYVIGDVFPGSEEENDINCEGGLAGEILDGTSKISNCYTDTFLVRYTGTTPENVIENSYYTWVRDGKVGLPWPWVHDGTDGYIGTQITDEELKGMAATLNEAVFHDDNAESPINNGYPIFKRQVTWSAFPGAGTYDKPFEISTVEDLVSMSKMEETAGIYFKLMNDIDMGDIRWETMIGTYEKPFKGIVNGNGHKIYNFNVAATKGENEAVRPFGLFAVIGGNAKLYNLGVTNIDVTLDQWEWNNYFGGLVGIMLDSAVVDQCYAKYVTFAAGWEPAGYQRDENGQIVKDSNGNNIVINEGHFNSAAGLVGLMDGAGCELTHSYATDISDGIVPAKDGANYHTIMFDAALLGRGERFARMEHCWSNGPVAQTKSGLWVEDCYGAVQGKEWYGGYGWDAWITDVWTLSDRWCRYFSPRGNNAGTKHGPTLKWEQYPGDYQNLVPDGSMDLDKAAVERIFGVASADIVSGTDNGFSSADVLKMPPNQNLTYTVPVEAGATYRVSFDGRTVGNSEIAFTFSFGEDIAATLKDNTLNQEVETKAAYVTASEAGEWTLTIGSTVELLVDNVEIVKVDLTEEGYGINENLRLDYHHIDALESEMYVDDLIYDGIQINYESTNGYIDGYGYLTNTVPVGFGTVDETYKAVVDMGATEIIKSLNLKVKKYEPYNIETLGLVDANGNVTFDMAKAEKLGTVKITENQASQGISLYAALYKNGVMSAMKTAQVVNGEAVFDLAIDGADTAKLFVLADGTIKPLGLPQENLAKLSDDAQITLHTIGDSICATYTPEDALKGWGQMIGESLDPNHVTVDNSLAQGGMTAINFVSNGRFETLLGKLKAGDYVVIQLTHNDQYVVTEPEFKALISQFVYGARQKGAIPVFVTSPETSTSATDTNVGGAYTVVPKIDNSGYPDVLRTMAAELGIGLVDINKMTQEYMAEKGHTGLINDGYWSTDTVHFGAAGARWIASNIAKGMKEIGLPIGAFVTAQ